MAVSKASPRRIIAKERRIEAMQLRRQGKTYQQIADHLGCSMNRAHQIVTEELAKLNRTNEELGGVVTRLELVRLDALLESVWTAAMNGCTKSVEAALRIADRRMKLLGLEAPTKINLTLEQTPTSELVAMAQKYGLSVPDSLLKEVGNEGVQDPAPEHGPVLDRGR